MILFDIETSGLNPLNSEIITIQLKVGDELKVWKLWEEKDELTMITKFFDFIKNSNEPVVGYNISRFDINFILTRLMLNNKLTDEIKNIVKTKRWIELTDYQGDSRGMNNLLKKLSVNRGSQVENRHIPMLYKLKMYDKIVEHAIDDLNACEEVIRKLNLKF